MSPFCNPIIKGFQIRYKSNNFDKVWIVMDLLGDQCSEAASEISTKIAKKKQHNF